MGPRSMVLQARRDERAVGQCAQGAGPLSVGSWSGASLRLPDAAVAPVAFVVDEDGDAWRLIALVEGVSVNGVGATRARLVPGDHVRLGAWELIVADASAPGLTSNAAPALRATLRWGGQSLDTALVRPGDRLTAGAAGSTFTLPLEGARWPLVAWFDGGWHAALDTPLHADLAQDSPLVAGVFRADGPKPRRGEETPARWVSIPEGVGLRFSSGAISIDVEACTPEALVPLRRVPAWRTEGGVRAVIFAMLLVTLLQMLRHPPPDPFLPEEAHLRLQQLAARSAARPPEELTARLERWRRLAEKESSAARASQREGRAGRPEGKQPVGPRSDAEIVKENKLLQLLASGVTERLLAGGAISAASQLGQLDGPGVSDAQGLGGLGQAGDGPGGGGHGESVGVGPVGTKGLGRDAAGAGKVAGRGGSELGLDEPADVDGGLDREVIRRVILAHRAQIRFCYEKALQSQSGLSGRVAAEFVIGADGSVTSARASQDTVGGDVAACVVSKVRTWSFPKPKGGGVVVVTYPFLFKPAGDR